MLGENTLNCSLVMAGRKYGLQGISSILMRRFGEELKTLKNELLNKPAHLPANYRYLRQLFGILCLDLYIANFKIS